MSQQINKYDELIKKRLKELSKFWSNKGTLTESMNYSLFNYGKLLRSKLLLLCLEEYGLDSTEYLDIACAIEMIQTYTLIHDDLPIMDDAKTRRNKTTNHLVFTPGITMLAGDALLTDAFYVLANANIDANIRVEIIKILSKYIGSNGICYGQVLDVENENNSNPYINDVDDIIINKASTFFIAIMEIVQLITKHSNNLLMKLGTLMGKAFQIKDDLNDYNNESIGKDNLHDINKITYISVLGINEATRLYDNIKKDITVLVNQIFKSNNNVFEFINLLLK